MVPVFARNIVNMSHTKTFDVMKRDEFLNSPAYYSFADTIFDWYMLADSNIVWSYRNGRVVSTFAESASRTVDRELCDYSTFGKLKVMDHRLRGYGNIWEPQHPITGLMNFYSEFSCFIHIAKANNGWGILFLVCSCTIGNRSCQEPAHKAHELFKHHDLPTAK